MRTPQVIVDSGVIVGLINKKDQWHEWAAESSAKLAPPFFTCEAVISEACHLLSDTLHGEDRVLSLVEAGHVQVRFSASDEVSAVRSLMRKYKDVPMAFADACIVRMSELIEGSTVFTVDGDFRIYRRNRRANISLVIPDQT